MVSSLTVVGIATWKITSNFKPGIELPSANGEAPPDVGPIDGAVNFLLVGNDSGGGNPVYGVRNGARNDVTVLVHLSEDHSNATIVTFPRDMFVPIPSCTRQDGGHYSAMSSLKINNAYSYGGVPCVAATVTALTGVPIDYAADLEFDGAVAVSDAIGGVEVCLATPIKDKHTNPPLDLPAGNVTLRGASAVSFLRTRYGVGDGSDLGRISNQQLFFAALVRQTREQMSNPSTLYRLADAASSHMSLSTNLQNLATLVSIAEAFKEVNPDKIVFVQYPNHYPTPSEPNVNGVLPTASTDQILNDALLADSPVVLTGGTGMTGATVLDPSVAPTAPTPDPSASAIPEESDVPSPPPDGVKLPGNAFGQTAADHTCSAN